MSSTTTGSRRASDAAPPLSVVMPSLNQAAFIEAAIRSVMEQPPFSTELIVMDGGSTDGTQSRLAALQGEFGSRLHWTSETDQGPAHAVNKAVRMARGDLLGWLNSDDLYCRGAIHRALDHFSAHPDDAMVYGHAEHIDIDGGVIEWYPSLPPEGAIERFLDGCFICQPTVFLRRHVWEQVGGLNERYRASFDFEMWLRLFRAHPGHIGFIDAVQAQSRLHEGGITLRFRETVAREGVQLLSDFFGHAPAHWLLTFFEEALAARTAATQTDPRQHFRALVAEMLPRIEPAQRTSILEFIDRDRRLALALPGLRIPVAADGWAGANLKIEWRNDEHSPSLLSLHCQHASPVGGPLSLRFLRGSTLLGQIRRASNGPFVVQLPLDPQEREVQSFTIEAGEVFVPAQVEPNSSDRRELAYLVEAVELT